MRLNRGGGGRTVPPLRDRNAAPVAAAAGAPAKLLLAALVAVLELGGGTASAAPTQERCAADYGYAGLIGRAEVVGISARVGDLAVPTVSTGHVAAWIGVSAGTSWLQVGISAFEGGATALYREVARPGVPPRYTQLVDTVEPGRLYALAVREVVGGRGRWQVFLDGRPVGAAVPLRGGGAPLLPMVMSESWNDRTASCNGFRFVFDGVRVATRGGGAWLPLRDAASRVDPGYRLQHAGSRVVASSRG